MAFDTPELIGETQAFAQWGDWITRRRQYFALYDADGKPHRNCGIVSGQFNNVPEKVPDLAGIARSLDGPVLFAGLAPQQFGHVLLTSLGRLWALERLPRDTTLYFVSKKAARPRSYQHLRPALQLFGIGNPVVVSRDPLRIDRAYLASDLFGEAHDGRGAPQFHDWVDRRLPPPGPVDAGRSVYVTRSRLGPGAGRFACEDYLEALLRDQGYEVFAPERHDLATQVRTFQQAGRLIFAEGSALHLYGLVARQRQKVAVVQRRIELPPLIEAQLTDRTGVRVEFINAIREVYWPPVPGDHYSIAILDFERLENALARAGMISKQKTAWTAPDDNALQASLTAGLKPGEKLYDEAGRDAYLRERRRRLRKRIRI